MTVRRDIYVLLEEGLKKAIFIKMLLKLIQSFGTEVKLTPFMLENASFTLENENRVWTCKKPGFGG